MRLLQGLLHNELTMRGLQSSLAALEVEPAGYYQLLLLDLGAFGQKRAGTGRADPDRGAAPAASR